VFAVWTPIEIGRDDSGHAPAAPLISLRMAGQGQALRLSSSETAVVELHLVLLEVVEGGRLLEELGNQRADCFERHNGPL